MPIFQWMRRHGVIAVSRWSVQYFAISAVMGFIGFIVVGSAVAIGAIALGQQDEAMALLGEHYNLALVLFTVFGGLNATIHMIGLHHAPRIDGGVE